MVTVTSRGSVRLWTRDAETELTLRSVAKGARRKHLNDGSADQHYGLDQPVVLMHQPGLEGRCPKDSLSGHQIQLLQRCAENSVAFSWF